MQVAITFPSDPSIKQPLSFDKQLGQGKFKVYLVKSSTLNAQYALKVFSRDFALRHHHSRETSVMSKVDHPHIIKHIPFLSHNFRMDILLTEYLPNGDFFDFVTKGYMGEEKLMRTYFHQLIEGLEYLHDNGIAHLDLKLDNLLLDADFNLKIIDFDQAHDVSESKLCSFGTTGYRAPEVRYNTCENFTAVDIYAAGVILYAFKTCEFPFMESDNKDEKEVPSYDEYVTDPEKFWREKDEEKENANFFSQEFKDLVNGMLKKDPAERFTIREIKTSKWYNGPVYAREEIKSVVERVLADIGNNCSQQ